MQFLPPNWWAFRLLEQLNFDVMPIVYDSNRLVLNRYYKSNNSTNSQLCSSAFIGCYQVGDDMVLISKYCNLSTSTSMPVVTHSLGCAKLVGNTIGAIAKSMCLSPYCPCTLNGHPFVDHLSVIMSITSLVLTPSTPPLLTIPPFYEPGTPPPTLPILIAQTEVGNIERPDKLLAQEELGTGPPCKNTSNSTDRFTPHPKAAPRCRPSKHSQSLTPPSLQTIPPFYDPGAPPPTLPILIAQTEVGNIEWPVKLLVQEELGTGPASKSTSKSTHRFTPYPKKHSRSLTLKHRDDVTSGTESDRASESDLDSATSEDNLIPKPDGEAGRPGWGGYNLEKTLRREHKKYCHIKVWDLFQVSKYQAWSHHLCLECREETCQPGAWPLEELQVSACRCDTCCPESREHSVL